MKHRHIPIDKVLHKLSGEGARPSIDMASRAPGTSRAEKTEALSPRTREKVRKGLARSAVVKQRINATEVHIRVHGTREYVGMVRKQNRSKLSYGYRLKGAFKEVSGFPTQESAILAMLLHV